VDELNVRAQYRQKGPDIQSAGRFDVIRRRVVGAARFDLA
jgi:hypothetical protein